MSIAFRPVRRVLLGSLAALSCLCIVLSCYLRPCFPHASSLWVLVSIPLVTMCGSLWSIIRRPVFQSPQSVALEATGAFAILPFELILAIFVLTVAPDLDSAAATKVFFALEVLVFASGALVLLYTAGLLVAAILTALSFDTEVWYRDIDASPSPFPLRVLVAFAFPCFPIAPLEPGPDVTAEDDGRAPCLPGCTCATKVPADFLLLPEHTALYEGATPPGTGLDARGSRSQSLVRLPNAVERRTSIAVAFDVL